MIRMTRSHASEFIVLVVVAFTTKRKKNKHKSKIERVVNRANTQPSSILVFVRHLYLHTL